MTLAGCGLLIFLIIFMRGSNETSADISGNNNEVENSSTQEISIFHWTSLSEKMEYDQKIQNVHNKTKYFLILVIIIILAVTLTYKCVIRKGKKKERRRTTESLELVQLHHDSLTKHGILKENKLTPWRREQIEKAREIKEKERKKEQKEKKGKGKQEIEEEDEEERARMQKPREGLGAGKGKGAGIEAGDLEQKPRSKSNGKKWVEKWVEVECSD